MNSEQWNEFCHPFILPELFFCNVFIFSRFPLTLLITKFSWHENTDGLGWWRKNIQTMTPCLVVSPLRAQRQKEKSLESCGIKHTWYLPQSYFNWLDLSFIIPLKLTAFKWCLCATEVRMSLNSVFKLMVLSLTGWKSDNKFQWRNLSLIWVFFTDPDNSGQCMCVCKFSSIYPIMQLMSQVWYSRPNSQKKM